VSGPPPRRPTRRRLVTSRDLALARVPTHAGGLSRHAIADAHTAPACRVSTAPA
jgi:hypothetical protein